MSHPPRPRGRRLRLLGASLALAGGAALAALPAAAAADDGAVMAKLGGNFSDAGAAAVAERTGLDLEWTIPEIGWAGYASDGDPRAAERLQGDPAVFRTDVVRPGEGLMPAFIPRDTIFQQEGTVGLNGQPVASWNWHWVKANFPAAWDISRGSANVKVAVIDSEFDTEHVELKTKLATGRNFDSGTPQYLTGDVRGTDPQTTHGTHVAGLVGAASDNGNGSPGACFDCVVIPYKISTSGSPFTSPNVNEKFVRDLAEALVEAGRSDAVVINMSLQTTRDYPALRDAVAFARGAGKVLVAAAGNFQQSSPGVPVYPGAYQGVIAVAATLPSDAIAPFSQNGDYVDVAAPGSPILSTWDSRIGPGADPAIVPTHGQGYRAESGTSMASPIVAGLAALMKTIRPDLNPDEVEALLKASAVDLGSAGPDRVYGAGRIDARRALELAQAFVRPAPAPPPVAAPAVRKRVRIFYTCKVGAKKVRVGKPGRLGVRRGARLTCKGRTAPALRRVQIDVQRFAARGGWKRISKVKTNNRGRFGFTVRLRSVGNWTVRAAFAGDPALSPAGSVRAKLLVTRRR